MRKSQREEMEINRLRLGLAAFVSASPKRSVRGKRKVAKYAEELTNWLNEVAFFVHDPGCGVNLVLAFFESDNELLTGCIDHEEQLKKVFTENAFGLLCDYARRLPETTLELGDRILEGILSGREGIRDLLAGLSSDYLEPRVIEHMYKRAHEKAAACADEKKMHDWLDIAAALARELLDAERFLSTLKMMFGEVPPYATVLVAEIHVRLGAFDEAAQWLLREPPADEDLETWDRLGDEVLDGMDDPERVKRFFLHFFRMRRTATLLEDVAEFFPEMTRDAFVRQEASEIMRDLRFSTYDAVFLVDAGHPELADRYVAARRNQLSGQDGKLVEELADLLAYNRGALGATLLYRELLERLLTRNRTSEIEQGLSYLNMIDLLDERVDDWGGVMDTDAYWQDLQTRHADKVAFWVRAGLIVDEP
ncbi:hypothetical protein KKC22_10755 [Myxococcota bacterium]|nr:hypothetical protein [Myxococcota bacterium]